MTMLHETSNNLMRRPADEHFADMRSIMAHANAAKARSHEVETNLDMGLFTETDGKLAFDVDGVNKPFDLSNWSLNQIATLTGLPMRAIEAITEKGRMDLVAQNLNVLLPRNGEARKVFYEDRGGDTYHLRSINGTTYSRLYDAEVLQAINEWLLPAGLIPALPTMNTDAQRNNIMGNNKPALFRGERDSHCFFYSDQNPGDDGLGGLRLGLMFTNSEVGTSSFKWSTFYFRDMCANFLIWDASRIKRKRVIHRGNIAPKWHEFQHDIRTIYNDAMARKGEDLLTFETAAKTMFAGDGSMTEDNKAKAAQRLNKSFGMSAKASKAAIEAATMPINGGNLSFWSVANGVTWNAKETSRAGQMVEDSAVAQKVLLAV
jgi:hypothetical protein